MNSRFFLSGILIAISVLIACAPLEEVVKEAVKAEAKTKKGEDSQKDADPAKVALPDTAKGTIMAVYQAGLSPKVRIVFTSKSDDESLVQSYRVEYRKEEGDWLDAGDEFAQEASVAANTGATVEIADTGKIPADDTKVQRKLFQYRLVSVPADGAKYHELVGEPVDLIGFAYEPVHTGENLAVENVLPSKKTGGFAASDYNKFKAVGNVPDWLAVAGSSGKITGTPDTKYESTDYYVEATKVDDTRIVVVGRVEVTITELPPLPAAAKGAITAVYQAGSSGDAKVLIVPTGKSSEEELVKTYKVEYYNSDNPSDGSDGSDGWFDTGLVFAQDVSVVANTGNTVEITAADQIPADDSKAEREKFQYRLVSVPADLNKYDGYELPGEEVSLLGFAYTDINTFYDMNIDSTPPAEATGGFLKEDYNFTTTTTDGLPAGLRVGPTRGMITGTPTAVQSLTNHYIQATKTDDTRIVVVGKVNIKIAKATLPAEARGTIVAAYQAGNPAEVLIVLTDVSDDAALIERYKVQYRKGEDEWSDTAEDEWSDTAVEFEQSDSSGVNTEEKLTDNNMIPADDTVAKRRLFQYRLVSVPKDEDLYSESASEPSWLIGFEYSSIRIAINNEVSESPKGISGEFRFADYSFADVSNLLPTGLTVNEHGRIGGTASEASPRADYYIQATQKEDSRIVVKARVDITIDPPDPLLTAIEAKNLAAVNQFLATEPGRLSRSSDLASIKEYLLLAAEVEKDEPMNHEGDDIARPILQALLQHDHVAYRDFNFTFDNVATRKYERIVTAEKIKILFERTFNHSINDTNRVDGYDTMRLLGLHEMADVAARTIYRIYRYNPVGVAYLNIGGAAGHGEFEQSIRNLGGSLAAYQIDREQGRTTQEAMWREIARLTGQRMRQHMARENGHGWGSGGPATQNLIVEYGMYAALFHDSTIFGIALSHIPEAKSGARIGSIGGGTDSHYEYLLKGYLLFGEPELEEKWLIEADNFTRSKNYHDNGAALEYADGGFDTLKAFIAGTMYLNSGLVNTPYNSYEDAKKNAQWNYNHYYSNVHTHRPEVLESTYYSWLYTKDIMYLRWQQGMLERLYKHYLNSDGSIRRGDANSYFFAETLKYPYLTFETDEVLTSRAFNPEDFKYDHGDGDRPAKEGTIVFNTEAHYNIVRWNNYAGFLAKTGVDLATKVEVDATGIDTEKIREEIAEDAERMRDEKERRKVDQEREREEKRRRKPLLTAAEEKDQIVIDTDFWWILNSSRGLTPAKKTIYEEKYTRSEEIRDSVSLRLDHGTIQHWNNHEDYLYLPAIIVTKPINQIYLHLASKRSNQVNSYIVFYRADGTEIQRVQIPEVRNYGWQSYRWHKIAMDSGIPVGEYQLKIERDSGDAPYNIEQVILSNQEISP